MGIIHTKKISPVSLTLIVISAILLVSAYNLRWKNEQWQYAVHTDALHYYRYLPIIFIDQQFDAQEAPPDLVKGFAGTTILYTPFFGAACILSYFVGLPVDGYSMLFPIFISIGSLFYLIFGLYFFSKFLKFYISQEWVICFTLFVMVFGTIAFHYSVNAPGWPHLPAFGLICFLLYHFKKVTTVFNTSSIVAIIAGTSFLFFTRPTDCVIVLLAPFFATNHREFIEIFKKTLHEKKAIIIGALIAFVPMACQLAIYKIYKGEFIIWSYGSKEGFDFLHPEIVNVLFSYAKGFFVYTPVCFLGLFGLYRLYKVNRYLFAGIIIYMIINIYIISSWWSWNYGYCFGARAFIEHYPVFFLLLALLLDIKSNIRKAGIITIISFFIFLNLFQTYQAETGILDLDYKTDSKGYWNVFLRLDRGYSGKYYRYPVDESQENIVSRKVFFNDMEKKDSTWLNPYTQSDERSYSGTYSSKVNNVNNYSVGLRKYMNEIPYGRNVLIRASGWFFLPNKGTGSYFAISFVNQGKAVSFNPFGLDGGGEDKFNDWEYRIFEIYMPKLPRETEEDPNAQIEFYFFNNSTDNCYLDDLKIEFVEYKNLNRVIDVFWD
jgi:hypothetical protein